MLGRDERGLALPSSLAVLSTVAVVVAGVVFFTTSPEEKPADQARPVATSPTAAPTSTAPEPTVSEEPAKKPRKVKKKKPAVQRGKVYVEVYNNSGISGLAGQTTTRASDAGWQVVGSDNWYGTIPASTVYYPERLKAAAKLLALDLGIKRTMPASGAMRRDRLTVVLTADAA